MDYKRIVVERVPGACGAAVTEVDIGQPLDPGMVAEIRAAFVEHHVLFFRSQKLDPESLARFGSYFGELEDYPFVQPLPGHSKVIPVIKEADETTNFGGGWHSDMIYRPVPAMGTMLYALEVPAHGGDTLYADGIKAFDALSPKMQELLSGLSVEYNVRNFFKVKNDRSFKGTRGNRSMPSLAAPEVVNTSPVHPLVRTHPESGLKGIYLSREQTRNFAGIAPRESQALLDWLHEHMTQPVFTTRFHWSVGDLAFWDNRCVNHYALNDYDGERRHMHRVTIAGDVPV